MFRMSGVIWILCVRSDLLRETLLHGLVPAVIGVDVLARSAARLLFTAFSGSIRSKTTKKSLQVVAPRWTDTADSK